MLGEITAGDQVGEPEPVPPGAHRPVPERVAKTVVGTTAEMAVFDQVLPVLSPTSLAANGTTLLDLGGSGRAPPVGRGPARGRPETTLATSTAR